MKKPIISLVIVILATFTYIYIKEKSMTDITSEIYQCSDGRTLNDGRWWTDTIQDPKNPNHIYKCGGHSENPEGKGASVPSKTCLSIFIDKCSATHLRTKMSVARQVITPVCTNGQCLLFGANTFPLSQKNDDPRTAIDILDLNSNDVIQGFGKIKEPRLAYAAINVGYATLVTGGYGEKDATGKGPILNTALFISPDGRQKTLQMVAQRGAHTITKLPDGTYLLLGGNGSDPKGAEIFNPSTEKFEAVESKMQFARKDHRAIVAKDGKVYIIAGTMGNDAPTAIEVYDPVTKTFSDSGLKLTQGREDAAVVYIPELDVIVVMGGEQKNASGEPESDVIEVIDLKKGTVTAGKLKTTRDEPIAKVLKVDSANRTAEILLVAGMKKENGTERSLPYEVVKIHF